MHPVSIKNRIIVHFQILGRIGHEGTVSNLLPAHITRIRKLRTGGFPSLRSHHNHTITGIHAIYCSGSVLQHRNTFDVTRIQLLEFNATIAYNTIDDIQRFSIAADVNHRIKSTRLTILLSYLQSRHLTL